MTLVPRKLADSLVPRKEWPIQRTFAWIAAYVAIWYWAWFLILPHP